jgi:hypothetical protein
LVTIAGCIYQLKEKKVPVNRKPPLLLALLFAIVPGAHRCAAELPQKRVLVEERFDQDLQSGLAKALLAHRHIHLAKAAGTDHSAAIRVDYVGYERGSQRVVVRYPLGAQVAQATLAFDVYFDKDFQWTAGGKLHGLGPKRPVTGGKPRRPDGWSARVMFKSQGHCATYLYDQDPRKTYGVGQTSAQPVFAAGRWHQVTLAVGLNDPGKANGWSRIRIDGREILASEQVEFRGSGKPETLIQQLLFCTFHGGHTPQWTPLDPQGKPTTVSAYFDNFRVTTSSQPDQPNAATQPRR